MEFEQNNQRRKKKKKNRFSRASQRVFTKKYNSESVERLKRLIQNHTDRGEERYFAIKVDNEFYVNKTSNPRYFDDYKEFIDGTTESIEVVMYFGKSNNCNRHIFYLKENSLGNVAPVDVDKKIEDALKKKDQDYLIKSLQDKVKEQSEYIENLEEELDDLSSKTDIRGLLKEGVALLGAFKSLPAANNPLSGTTEVKEDSKVEVEPAESEEKEEAPQENKQKDMFDSVYQQFGEGGTKKVVALMMKIANSEKFRDGVNKLIDDENKQKTEEKNKGDSS